MKSLVLAAILATNMLMWLQPAPAAADTVISPEQARQSLAVRNVSVTDGVVSGELVNHSSRPVHDVELQIRHLWHWKNEFRPGKDAPGRADLYTLGKDVAPGEAVPFTYTVSSPFSSRGDGYFETQVSVAGFITEAGQASKSIDGSEEIPRTRMVN